MPSVLTGDQNYYSQSKKIDVSLGKGTNTEYFQFPRENKDQNLRMDNRETIDAGNRIELVSEEETQILQNLKGLTL